MALNDVENDCVTLVTAEDVGVSVKPNRASGNDGGELFQSHLWLAERLTRKRKLDLPRSVSYSELLSAAQEGLLDASRRFDPLVQPNFRNFAKFRILGSIDDYLRTCIWGGRTRRMQRWSIDFKASYPDGGNGSSTFQDALSKEEKSCDMDTEDFFKYVTAGVPKDVATMLRMYYVDGSTMREIGRVFGLCEARVSQLFSEYRKMLREKWGGKECDLWACLDEKAYQARRLARELSTAKVAICSSHNRDVD